MAQNESEKSSDEEPLREIFDQAMALFESIENSNEATNSDAMQMKIKMAISKCERATELVSLSGMFSRNEALEELGPERLRYLLLPALLAALTLRLAAPSRDRLVQLADIYYRDFLQRCRDYGVCDAEPPPSPPPAPRTEHDRIANMVMTREAKIKRYKEEKELKEKLSVLAQGLEGGDEEQRREYLLALLRQHAARARDELASLALERRLLAHRHRQHDQHDRQELEERSRAVPAPLRPVVITREGLRRGVFGLGYPAPPALSVEEFYEQRVREGAFPGGCARPPPSAAAPPDTDEDEDEAEEAERARLQALDEYKDTHRRGWGNTYNRS